MLARCLTKLIRWSASRAGLITLIVFLFLDACLICPLLAGGRPTFNLLTGRLGTGRAASLSISRNYWIVRDGSSWRPATEAERADSEKLTHLVTNNPTDAICFFWIPGGESASGIWSPITIDRESGSLTMTGFTLGNADIAASRAALAEQLEAEGCLKDADDRAAVSTGISTCSVELVPLGLLNDQLVLVAFGLVISGCACRTSWAIRAARLARGLCPNCKYVLVGLPAPACPECGFVTAEYRPLAQRRSVNREPIATR